MRRIGEGVSRELLANPRVDTVNQQIGRAELSEDPWGPHRSEFHIELKHVEGGLPPAVETQVEEEIREIVEKVPGVQFELLTFLGDRIGESISGSTAQVVASVYGDDLDLLDAKASEVARSLSAVPGSRDVQRGALPGMPSLEVELRRERLAALGFTPLQVMEAVQIAYEGRRFAQVHDGPRTDVVAILPEAARRDRGADAVVAAGGAAVALRDLPTCTRHRPLPARARGGRRRQS